MTVVFQASDEALISSRLEQWRHVVDQTFGPAHLRPPSRTHVPQRLVVGDLGAVRVSELRIAYPTPSSDRCQAARTPRLIRQSDPEPERYRVDLLVRGQMVVEQAGREAALEPGDFTVVDWSRPARWTARRSWRPTAGGRRCADGCTPSSSSGWPTPACRPR
jgi:hypothetical protein